AMPRNVESVAVTMMEAVERTRMGPSLAGKRSGGEPGSGIDGRAVLRQLYIDGGAGRFADGRSLGQQLAGREARGREARGEREVAVAVIDGEAAAEARHLAHPADLTGGDGAHRLAGVGAQLDAAARALQAQLGIAER